VTEGSVSKSCLELLPRSGNELNEGGKEENEGGTGIGDRSQESNCGSVSIFAPGRSGRLIHSYYIKGNWNSTLIIRVVSAV
jgi:hypothetical protein